MTMGVFHGLLPHTSEYDQQISVWISKGLFFYRENAFSVTACSIFLVPGGSTICIKINIVNSG